MYDTGHWHKRLLCMAKNYFPHDVLMRLPAKIKVLYYYNYKDIIK
jgi:hypothetical protein